MTKKCLKFIFAFLIYIEGRRFCVVVVAGKQMESGEDDK